MSDSYYTSMQTKSDIETYLGSKYRSNHLPKVVEPLFKKGQIQAQTSDHSIKVVKMMPSRP
jgi:hypothetical protein